MDKKLIYIIDDSKTILKHAEGVLIGSYRVSLFERGQEALDQMRLVPPDLVLLDINMPQMDGYAVFRRMRDSSELRKIPATNETSDYAKPYCPYSRAGRSA